MRRSRKRRVWQVNLKLNVIESIEMMKYQPGHSNSTCNWRHLIIISQRSQKNRAHLRPRFVKTTATRNKTMADVLVLYQISNDFPRHHGGSGGVESVHISYNAFYMSRKNGITLSNVKQSCRALQSINPRGADGYHWRVRIDEKPNTSHSSAGSSGGGSGSVAYSWWDVQDENARLPVKEASSKELRRLIAPPKIGSEGDVVTQEMTKAAKGAIKYMGKAMNAVAAVSSNSGGIGDIDDDINDARTPVICFKLLDLGKVRRDLNSSITAATGTIGTGGGAKRSAPTARRPARSASSSMSTQQQPAQQQRPARASAPTSGGAPRVQPQQTSLRHQHPTVRSPPTADLMGFNTATPAPHLHHSNSMPMPMPTMTTISTPTGAMPGETRAEKLKREYAQKQTTNRVWDDVDQRWVEGPVKNGETTEPSPAAAPSLTTTSALNDIGGTIAGVKGITLSRSNAVGKSENVQAAVNARIDDMEQSQQKAIEELRTREVEKAKADAEEDVVRQRLEPKLKAWAEEHGQKKQLRALLANLHTILWEGSGWKPISLADVLDDSKVKKVYFQASRVVHPDKTGHLDAEKRFVAKRVFDSLTQAKVDFDEGKR